MRGHLLEGAIAYFDATERRRLLDIMIRYVDHIAATFGTGAGQKPGYCGHPEIELALVKLYRVTRDRKHLDLAAYFVNQRGAQPHYFDIEARRRGEDPAKYYFKTYEYSQSHKPVQWRRSAISSDLLDHVTPSMDSFYEDLIFAGEELARCC